MFTNTLKNILLPAAALAVTTTIAQAQTVKEPVVDNPEWAQPYQPYRIAGNLYYVGTYDLCAYLITTPQGHILINTGLAASDTLIKAGVEKLGFAFKDIKVLLTTQAHYDHLGAMASVKKQTGARMMVDYKDAAVLKDGGSSDYAFGGDGSSFAPVQPDRILHDKDTISLGGTTLAMLHHPGHTKGSCSYLLNVKDQHKTWRVLIANMPTIVTEKDFHHLDAYPEIAADYAYTLKSMKALRFDLWVSSHASQFDMHTKHKPGDAYNPQAFSGRKDYDERLRKLQAEYDKKVAGKKQ
ncbi:metallo-beta-lactamase class B [Filimonas zeae]|uniref:Subclass B3 metallo-beta-lactamase BJP-1 n=1 Tax=Filimonas zeae TaxID=1737353 RepID=A0A917MWT8_9BACT|nr:subclass B3 metallo-beta-lactamase [Filimonas zeae]MDR6340058.1 metallo-beta-lactamase class B [Filimonas zeae]GGH70938.1 subclass B3 metallo-beta-lactamase BJP-1 [Filimonas zeae]